MKEIINLCLSLINTKNVLFYLKFIEQECRAENINRKKIREELKRPKA